MSYTRWWHSLLISFSVVTWGLAQPIYTIINSAGVNNDEISAVLLVMLVYQVVPTALLFLIDRAIIRQWGGGKALKVTARAFSRWQPSSFSDPFSSPICLRQCRCRRLPR